MSGRLDICFVAPYAYPVLARDRHLEVVGGAEVQHATLARALSARGHQVSMVCLDFGQPDVTVVDGVTVYRAHAPTQGVPGLRFFHPRLTGLWRAMRRANARIYYQRCASALTAITAAFARGHGRRFVFAGASDADFDRSLPMVGNPRDRALYRWGVRRADAVVSQHAAQQEACRTVFGLDSAVIRSAHAHAGRPGRHDGLVLWVGTIKPIKAPEVFVDLARACPRWRFRMIGGGEPAFVRSVRQRAQGLANLEFAGFVPYAEVEDQFDGAALLVNTSPVEGFPNTFLQAWSRGIPTLSFVETRVDWMGAPVGAVVGTLAEMCVVLERWKNDADAWHEAGRACRNSYESAFSIDTVLAQYEALFESVERGRKGETSVREAVE